MRPIVLVLALQLLGIATASRPVEAARAWSGAPRLFRPLLADPRENQFRMAFSDYTEQWRYGTDITDSLSRGGYEERSETAWDVAIGATVRLDPMKKLLGWGGPWGRYQLGSPAGVFAHFDRGTKELINADYQFGFALDMLWTGGWSDSSGTRGFSTPVVSSRLTIQHRSTHLGDEYLALGDFGSNQEGHPDEPSLFRHPPVKRVDLSYESVRLILSVESSPGFLLNGRSTLRAYGGGELKWAIRPRTPSNFSSPIAQAGLEWRSAGNEIDPHDGWLARGINAPFGRPYFEVEWFVAGDWKLARPYNFAGCDNPGGDEEAWTPHLWTDCRHGEEFDEYAGSWHAMVGLSLAPGAHRRVPDGGQFLSPEMLIALEWYGGYSPNGQFLDQKLRNHPLYGIVPSITIHF